MYQSEISRNNPALILFLFDCSYSMSEKYMDTGMSKGKYLAKISNESIDQLILSCEKGDELRSYFEIGVLGYGNGATTLIPISTVVDLANKPLKLEKSSLDGVEVERPIWITDPTREWNTDMKAGFELAKQVVGDWSNGHKVSFPPVIIHVSDGEWTADNPVAMAQSIQSDIFTDDGPPLLLNIHISNSSSDILTFPDMEPQGNDFQRGLYNMSSVLPDSFLKRAQEMYGNAQAGARGYMFNANPEDLSKFFDIGTRLIG